MTQNEISFLTANKINFESVALGFCRNIQQAELAEYERLYRAYIDPHFVLIYYCGACVFDMIKRLSNHYDTVLASQKLTSQTVTSQATPKPSRSKKSK
jgi:hypothetical protein